MLKRDHLKLSVMLPVLLVALLQSAHSQAPSQQDQSSMINYSIGYQIGSDFRLQEFELDPEMVLKGIEDAIRQNNPQLSAAERRQAMSDLGQRVFDLKQQRRQTLQQNQAKQDTFFADNAKQPGVVTTASGLQYKIIKQGQGQPPGFNDRVLVNYRGRLLDGQEFDSSYKRNRPASFGVGQVIKGWTEALQLMPPGSSWQIFVPPELGYGARGAGNSIPPNSILIFDIELLAVQ